MVLVTGERQERLCWYGVEQFPADWSGHWKRAHTTIYRPDGSVLPPKPEKQPLTVEALKAKKAPLAWLKAVVDGLDVGEEINGKPIHANTSYAPGHPLHGVKNARMIALINERMKAGRERRPARMFPSLDWNNENLAAHCGYHMTLFYVGSPFGLMLVAFDVDNKRRGSAEGALALCDHLASFELFENMYHEPSRGGVGRHANFILDPCDLDVPGAKSLLKMACIWANEEAQKFDVEKVEMKGLPPEAVIQDGRVQSYKAGVLATVPRGLIDRFDEIKQMPVVRADDLRELVSPAYARHLEQERERKPVRKESRQHEPSTGLRIIFPVVESIRGKHISEERLAGLEKDGCYWQMAYSLLGDRRLPTTADAVTTALDLAILLMVLEFCTENMPDNGGLPENRVAELWKALKKSDDIERAYNHHRLTVLRNFLSDRGMIDWTSSKYRLGWYRENGEYVPGECMKWKLDQKVMEELEKLRSGSKDCEKPAIAEQVGGTNAVLLKKGRRVKAPSMETTFCEQFPICHPDDQIRPVVLFHDRRFLFRPPDSYPTLPSYQQQLAA